MKATSLPDDIADLVALDATLAGRGLPAIAYIQNNDRSPGEAPIIAVKRGQMGCWPIYTSVTAERLNQADGVTPAMATAMHVGSMSGWHVPGADPAFYSATTLHR